MEESKRGNKKVRFALCKLSQRNSCGLKVSSSCGKLQDEQRVNSGKPEREIEGNPEPSHMEGAETRHSLPKSKDMVKV